MMSAPTSPRRLFDDLEKARLSTRKTTALTTPLDFGKFAVADGLKFCLVDTGQSNHFLVVASGAGGSPAILSKVSRSTILTWPRSRSLMTPRVVKARNALLTAGSVIPL